MCLSPLSLVRTFGAEVVKLYNSYKQTAAASRLEGKPPDSVHVHATVCKPNILLFGF